MVILVADVAVVVETVLLVLVSVPVLVVAVAVVLEPVVVDVHFPHIDGQSDCVYSPRAPARRQSDTSNRAPHNGGSSTPWHSVGTYVVVVRVEVLVSVVDV